MSQAFLFMFLKVSVQISTSFLIKLFSYLMFFQFFIQSRYQSFMRCIVIKNLFQFYSLLCYRMMVSFVEQKTFRFMNYHLPIVVLSPCVIGICLVSLVSVSEKLFLTFSSIAFFISFLRLRSLFQRVDFYTGFYVWFYLHSFIYSYLF